MVDYVSRDYVKPTKYEAARKTRAKAIRGLSMVNQTATAVANGPYVFMIRLSC
jgi:hypothetical protein